MLILGLFSGLFFVRQVSKKPLEKAPLVKHKTSSFGQFSSLAIPALRQRKYEGSDIKIEKELQQTHNYKEYLTSYKSDNLKIYALLTIPTGSIPKGGFPAIIFNHGYIPPAQYTTTGNYEKYVDYLASRGFVVFKPDYRGNGQSEGKPSQSYISPDYTVDVLNAFSSLKKFKKVNPEKIGMFGHSMGGNITLRSLVVSPDIKAAVIWAGVVGNYEQIINWWKTRVASGALMGNDASTANDFEKALAKLGTPKTNPLFWQSIDPYTFLKLVTSPVELNQGLMDSTIPSQMSQTLADSLQRVGKNVTLYTYPTGDHNLSGDNFDLAMQRTVEFFTQYLK